MTIKRDPAGTRQRILSVARSRFAKSGYDVVSVRSVAKEAGVDPALVHHYFGTKRALFLDAVAVPVDPGSVVGPVLAGPREQMGKALLREVLGLWDSEQGEQMRAVFRSVLLAEAQICCGRSCRHWSSVTSRHTWTIPSVVDGLAPRWWHPRSRAS